MEKISHPVISKGEYSEYVLPPSELFGEVGDLFYESLENIKRATTDLINTLKQYKIPAKFSSGSFGLRLNHFILIPESGEDIELLIEKISLVMPELTRIWASKSQIHLDVPKYYSGSPVNLANIINDDDWINCDFALPIPIGISGDSVNETVILDLAELKHVIIGGQTGSGKSVLMNSIIAGLLNKFSPDEVRFIMADLKMVEFDHLKNLPHLQFPIANSTEETLNLLLWTKDEIKKRLSLFIQENVKNITEYNASHNEKIPRIVFFIDDLADLILDSSLSKHLESAVYDIAGLKIDCGIHLIVSTQRPSKTVITEHLKKFIPARIAFKVSSYYDSRVVLDTDGAGKLFGHGDMLIKVPGKTDLLRVQGAWIPDPLIQPLVDHICKLPKAPDPMMQKINDMAVADVSPEIRQYLRPDDTQGFLEAVKFVIATGKMGVSYLQRNLHISYNRAAEYMDLLRERGVIKN